MLVLRCRDEALAILCHTFLFVLEEFLGFWPLLSRFQIPWVGFL